MRLINGQGRGDGKPKGKLVLIKQDTRVRFDVIYKDGSFHVYDQYNNEVCLRFKHNQLKDALDICLLWNINELKEIA